MGSEEFMNWTEYRNMRFPGILIVSVLQVLLVIFDDITTRTVQLCLALIRTIINCDWMLWYDVFAKYGGLYGYSYSFTIWGYFVIGTSILLAIISVISFSLAVKKRKRRNGLNHEKEEMD